MSDSFGRLHTAGCSGMGAFQAAHRASGRAQPSRCITLTMRTHSAQLHGRMRAQVNSRFKRLVLLVIARAMPPGEQAGLKRLFERLDLDASGCLSLSELRAGLLYINKQVAWQRPVCAPAAVVPAMQP